MGLSSGDAIPPKHPSTKPLLQRMSLVKLCSDVTGLAARRSRLLWDTLEKPNLGQNTLEPVGFNRWTFYGWRWGAVTAPGIYHRCVSK